MNWKNATIPELIVVILYDHMARGTDIFGAMEELESRGLKVPRDRTQFKLKAVYPR
jgi:hypothetical protein